MVVVGLMVRDVGRGMLQSLKNLSDLCVQLKIDFSKLTRLRHTRSRLARTSNGQLGLCQLAETSLSEKLRARATLAHPHSVNLRASLPNFREPPTLLLFDLF